MPAYTRSFWSGLNTTAFAVRITGTIAILSLIPGLILATTNAPIGILVAGSTVVVAVVTGGLGVVALRRSGREGGRGLAIWAISVVPVVAIPCGLLGVARAFAALSAT